ncbi:hypothetical protein PtB15_2B903 [Puccinia triticina]|nr:hypothetical protein PtB15_2B903 [Puccinia triticina]
MNPVARPRHATSYDPYSYSSTHEDERSSPPGEPTGGILTATCDTLLAFKHPFIPRPQTPSPNGIDSVEREEVSNAAPSCLLAPAKSHVTTELGALKTGALAARSRLKVVDRCQPAPDQPQGSTEPGNEATNSTGSGLDATTHGEIAWFQHSEAAHNVRLRVVQPVEIADGDEQGQTGSSGVIAAMGPATAGRSEELNISPASTSSSLLSGDKNRDVKVVSAPSSSYLVSPLAEVTDAYTGLQGGWGLPSLTPGFDLKHQHIPHKNIPKAFPRQKRLAAGRVLGTIPPPINQLCRLSLEVPYEYNYFLHLRCPTTSTKPAYELVFMSTSKQQP